MMSGLPSRFRSAMAANHSSPVRRGSWCGEKPPFPSDESNVNARLNGSCSLLDGPVALAVATISSQPSLLPSATEKGYGLGPTGNDCGTRVKLPRPSPRASEISFICVVASEQVESIVSIHIRDCQAMCMRMLAQLHHDRRSRCHSQTTLTVSC